MLVVVLVISKPGHCRRWDAERAHWLRRAKSAPPWVIVKLIEGRNAIKDGDPSVILNLDVEDSFVPGIYQKSILAIQKTLEMFPNVTHVIRTNLSTFIIWSRLYEYLTLLDPIYSGVSHNSSVQVGNVRNKSSWVGGFGIVLSRKTAQILTRQGGKGSQYYESSLPDDVVIGTVLLANSISCVLNPPRAMPLIRSTWHTPQSFTVNMKRITSGPDTVFVRLRGAPTEHLEFIINTLERTNFRSWRSRVALSSYFTLRKFQNHHANNIYSQLNIYK